MRTHHIEQRDLAPRTTAVLRSTLAVAGIGPFIGHAVEAVTTALAAQGIAATGPPFARYHRTGEGEFAVEAGLPTASAVAPRGEVLASSLPGGPVAVMTHVGPYDEMEPAYQALADWVAARGGAPAGDPWEVYLTDPEQEPDPQRWRTEIVMPVRA